MPTCRIVAVRACFLAAVWAYGCSGGRSAWAGEIHDAAAAGDLAKAEKLLASDPKLLTADDDHGDNPLHVAALNGRVDIAKLLLARGADVNAASHGGFEMTPLFCAIYNGHRDIVEMLLAAGADANARLTGGKTTVHFAARGGYTEIAALLIAKGVEVNTKDEYGETPLGGAAGNNNRAVAELLAAKGAELDICAACWLGRADRVKALLDADPRLISATYKGETAGKTPICWAADGGNSEVINLLVARGADVRAVTKRGTPLEWAAARGHVDAVVLLIAKGADVNQKASDGRPLHSAAAAGHKLVVETLIAKGADVNARDDSGNTALFFAAWEGHKDVAELLIARGADVNAKCGFGTPPLLIAAQQGHGEVADLLIAKGAKADIFCAAALGREDRVRALLKEDPTSVRARGPRKRTALFFAAQAGRTKVVEVLLDAGAEIDARSDTWCSPLGAAILFGHEDVAELLRKRGARE